MAKDKADIIARFFLDTGSFDRNLDASKKKISTFASGIRMAGGILGSLAGVVGVATTGVAAWNKTINSSQAIHDAFNERIEGIKAGVDEFFYSIANGDWSNFLNGLNDVISRAREAAQVLDLLGNTRMSYNYFNVKNQAELQDQIAILKDKTSTKEAKAQAKKKMDEILKRQQEMVDTYTDRTEEAMKKVISAWTGIPDVDISQFDTEKIFWLDISKTGDKEKARLSKEYEEYKKKQIEIKNKYSTEVADHFGNAHKITDWAKVRKEMVGINKQYQDAIFYNGYLNKMTNKQLQNVMNMGQAADEVKRNFTSMKEAADRASQSDMGGTPKEYIPAGSLADLQNQLAQAKKNVANAVGAEAQMVAQETVNEIEKRIERMNFELETKIFQKSRPLTDNVKAAMSDVGNRGSLGALANKNIPDTLDFSNSIKSVGEVANDTFGRQLNKIYDFADGLGYATRMADSLSGAFSSMGQEGVAALFNVGASIAEGIQQYTEITQAAQAAAIASGTASAAKMPFPFNLAAIATVVSTIMSVFSSLHRFESGGIVPGASYSGDKVIARVNSGEMILNKEQQRNLFNLINAGGISNHISVDGEARVSGKDLYIAIRNYMKSTNKTW